MATMTPTKLRSLRISDDDWRSLQNLAWWIVPDDTMPADARKDAGRVTQLMRMIARGEVHISQNEKPA